MCAGSWVFLCWLVFNPKVVVAIMYVSLCVTFLFTLTFCIVVLACVLFALYLYLVSGVLVCSNVSPFLLCTEAAVVSLHARGLLRRCKLPDGRQCKYTRTHLNRRAHSRDAADINAHTCHLRSHSNPAHNCTKMCLSITRLAGKVRTRTHSSAPLPPRDSQALRAFGDIMTKCVCECDIESNIRTRPVIMKNVFSLGHTHAHTHTHTHTHTSIQDI